MAPLRTDADIARAAACRSAAAERASVLGSTGILAERHGEGWDRLTRLAAHVAGTMAVLAVADEQDLVFLSSCSPSGRTLPEERIPLSRSLGRHVIGGDLPLVITDARTDLRLHAMDRAVLLGVLAYAGFPLHTPDGRVIGTLAVVSDQPREWEEATLAVLADLAATAEIEVALGVRNRELEASLADQLLEDALTKQVEAVRRLEQLDSARTEFIANTSHELRTPVTSILGYTSLLAGGVFGPLTPRQVEAVERIERNSRRLRRLVEDLLTLTHLDAGGFEVRLAPVDLADLGARAVEAVQPLLRGRDLALDLRMPERRVSVDAAAVERVLVNLLTNAVKYTPDGGSISLHARIRDGVAVLEVADSGVGIPEEDQERLFTRFHRSTGHQDLAVDGTGLGLAIARAIVEAHHGTIRVDSRVGQGTKVVLGLPTGG